MILIFMVVGRLVCGTACGISMPVYRRRGRTVRAGVWAHTDTLQHIKDGRFCHVLDVLCQVMASSCVDEEAVRTRFIHHREEEELQAARLALKKELDAFFLYALSHIRQTCSTATLLFVVKAFLGMEVRYLREKMQQAPHAIPEMASPPPSPLSALVDNSLFFKQRDEEMVENHIKGEKVDQKDVQTVHEDHKGDEANERGRKRWQHASPEKVWKEMAENVWGRERSANDTKKESRPSSSSSVRSFASYRCFSSFVTSEVLPHFSFLPYDVETLFCSSPLVGKTNASNVLDKSRTEKGGCTGGSQSPSKDATTKTEGQDGDDESEGLKKESKKESNELTETKRTVREVEKTFSSTAASLTPSDMEARALFHLLLLNGNTVVEASREPSRNDEKEEVVEPHPEGVETEKSADVEGALKEEKKMGVHGWSMTDTVVEMYRRSLAGPLQRLWVFYLLLSRFHRIRLERESLLTSSAVGSASFTAHASTCRYPRQKDFFFHDTSLLLPLALVHRIIVTVYPLLSPLRNVLVMHGNDAEKKEMKREDEEAPKPIVSSPSSFSDSSVDVFSFLRICNHYHNAEIQHHCRAPSSRSSFDTDACCWKEHWVGGGTQEKKMAPLGEVGAVHRASLSFSEMTRPWMEEKTTPKGGKPKKEGETERGTHSGRTTGREQVGCDAAAVIILCPARTPWIAVETPTQPNETEAATKTSAKCQCGSAAEIDSKDPKGKTTKRPFEEDHKGVAQSSGVPTTTTIENRSVAAESRGNPTPSSSTLPSGVDNEKNKIKGSKAEDPAVALRRRRIKNERVDLIQRASNAYYYDQLLHRQDGASSRSSSPHSSSRTNSPDGGRTHSSVSSGVGSGGSGVRPFYERLFDGDQFEKYAGLSSKSNSCSSSLYSGTVTSSSYMGDARNTLQSIWNDMSIGVDVLVMLFSGAAIGYFLGALRGASEGERLLYMVIGVTVMLFVDGLLLMTRMHHEDLRKERTLRRRQKTLAAQNRRNTSLLVGQNSRCQQPSCAEDTPLKNEQKEKSGSAK